MSTGRWLSIVIVLLVLTFFASCSRGAPLKTSPASLVVKDVHVAAWMTLDNGFMRDAETPRPGLCKGHSDDATMNFGMCGGTYADPMTDLRPGVLFQIGPLVVEGEHEDDFDYVQLKMKTDTMILKRGEFDWLDINAKGERCTIDPLHAYAMFQGPGDDPRKTPIVKTKCDGVKLVPDNTPRTCLRERGIQAGLVPDTALITYWPGPANYTMAMSVAGHAFTYSFSLGDEVTVDHWLAGCFKVRYTDVTEILIHYEGSPNHAGFPHPPMNGEIVPPDDPHE